MKTLSLSVLMLLSVIFASAQTSATASNTVNVTITNSISITAVNNATQNLTVASVSDFTNGVETTNASTFSVASNRLFTISVVPTANTFSHTTGWAGASTTLPVSALEVRKNGTTNYTPFSSTSNPITIMTDGARGAATTFGVDYKANPGLNNDYPTDTYKITLTYTATQQ